MARVDGRASGDLRPVVMRKGVSPYAEGSCEIAMGETRVLCTASVEEGAPPWRKGTGLGWITAEYAMLPRATSTRTNRERRGPGGRTSEIQRLIGRSLRACVSGFDFGEFTIRVDCDVLQADGGTRTASITGGTVALHEACNWLSSTHNVPNPFAQFVAAVSVGVVDGEPMLDLCYAEDGGADVDCNIVMAEPDQFVEVQGTGEQSTFDRLQFDTLLDLGTSGIATLFALQRSTLSDD